MSVIAKFVVTSVEMQGHSHYETHEPVISCVKVNMSPVHQPKDKTHENYRFWSASPQGQLWLQINNPGAFDSFKTGEEQYLVFVNARGGKEGLISELEAMVAHLRAQTGKADNPGEAGV
jgi:hypothetical protein